MRSHFLPFPPGVMIQAARSTFAIAKLYFDNELCHIGKTQSIALLLYSGNWHCSCNSSSLVPSATLAQ
ncbi:hypothetical protein H6F98_22485 [Microcoleus sp. FACHB-SPT15]|uniref:hypothetical protein n=1 Tax=Microcoleus sp. FACHB-SPT15 TaxID=2692830 RepID=UPI0017810FB4|nr:hypothetical protein [Microcoleus sp. FACHB-SPT15]MBD1808198.1 hypothetical protein [Microcoleus sp. FACHB-SPT15]